MSQLKARRVSSSAKIAGQRHETNSNKISNNLGPSSRAPNTSNGPYPSHHTKGASCKNNNFAYICSGCNKPIRRDKFLLKACDKYWHENCLKCDRCHSRLGELGSTLYCKSNMNLCRQDYLEMFGKTGVCSVCEKMICASEMVMRAKQNVYHLECFACQLCSQRFCVGDRFYLCENKVVCQYDYEEHILPIQHSMMAEQTADPIYLAPGIDQPQPTTPSKIHTQAIEFGTGNKDSMIEHNPVEQPPGCSGMERAEGDHSDGCELASNLKDTTGISPEELGEAGVSGNQLMEAAGGEPEVESTDGCKGMEEKFEAVPVAEA